MQLGTILIIDILMYYKEGYNSPILSMQSTNRWVKNIGTTLGVLYMTG